MSSQNISSALRQLITEQSHYRCSYCQTQMDISGIQFTIDHIIPESLGGLTEEHNLCLACWDCNLIKQNRIRANDPQTAELVPLFHPRQQLWHEHFVWQEGGLLVEGLTPIGRATVAYLRLNRPILLKARQRWIKVGWHPPQ
jgi:hypothetical protein